MNFITKFGMWLDKMFNKSSLADQLEIMILESEKMNNYIELWKKIYKNEAPWLYDSKGEKKLRSSGIAPLVCSYMANLITLEMISSIEEPELNHYRLKAGRFKVRLKVA